METETPIDKLAELREAAKVVQPTRKMTARAAAALRASGEHDKADKAADAPLVEQFNSKTKSVEFVMDVLYAISPMYTRNIRARAIKAFYMLSRGLKVYTIHDVSFFGSLLPEEETMSLSKIIARYPVDESETIGPVKVVVPERLCALGSKCLRSCKRKAATVTGKSAYCSQNCRGAAQAAKRRVKAVANIPVIETMASETRDFSGLAGGVQ